MNFLFRRSLFSAAIAGGLTAQTAPKPAAPAHEHAPVALDQFVTSATPFKRNQVDLAQSTTVLAGRALLLKQQPTLGATLGGETGIRALVDRFYDLMDTAPEAVNVRALHATSLKASREKLYLFLTGWTGGPDLYVEQFGHPQLRMRHFPFAIGARERDEWLWCMDRALTEHAMSEELRGSLRLRTHQLADHMRNQPE